MAPPTPALASTTSSRADAPSAPLPPATFPRPPSTGSGPWMPSVALLILLLAACEAKPRPWTTRVVVHVVDADSRADVIGARVFAAPGGTEATTDSSGRATFVDLPAGTYKFTAAAPALKLSGASIVSDSEQAATSEEIAVTADAGGTELALRFPRIDRDALNLVTLHSGTSDAHAVANCKACHGDRKSEISAEPAILPWHAMKVHSSMPCTYCHRVVDLDNHSAGTIRKQVNVALCVGCHPRFPTFPSSL